MKIAIELTKKCNKNCWFCYANASLGREEEIEFRQLASFINELSLLKSRPVLCFGGGEPFLYSEIKVLLEFLEQKGYPYSVTSNLINATPELVSLMKRGWLWGSIHHPSEAGKVIKKLKSLKKENVGVNILVMRSYLDQIYDVVDKVVRSGLKYILTFFKPYGRAKDCYEEYLTAEERKEVIIEFCRRYDGVYTDGCQGFAGSRCTCGVNWFVITADLQLKPNSFYPAGVQMKSLTLLEFMRAQQLVPKRVHETEGV